VQPAISINRHVVPNSNSSTNPRKHVHAEFTPQERSIPLCPLSPFTLHISPFPSSPFTLPICYLLNLKPYHRGTTFMPLNRRQFVHRSTALLAAGWAA